MDYLNDPAFSGIKPFEKKIYLSSPTMYGDEQKWVDEAIRTNWVSTVGENIDVVEKTVAEHVGVKHAVALASGTSALHLAARLAGEKVYGIALPNEGALKGRKVFCSDCTFSASGNPIAYENGEAVFIDSEYDTWNMCPKALEKAFEIYPDVKIVIVVHLYGTPAKMNEIKAICDKHGAMIIEDAAESLGAEYKLNGKWAQTGSMGKINCISFNGNKIITGSSGGMFLTDDADAAKKVRKWSTQSREKAVWYQHEEIGYNYRMSNIIAGLVRGQMAHLDEHIAQKKAIYERYEEGFKGLPVSMNPWDRENSRPNFWLSCMIIDSDAMTDQFRNETEYHYKRESGKSCPHEILDALTAFNIEGCPIWKPLHLQPVYKSNSFITADGNVRGKDFDDNRLSSIDVGADVFRRGLCLPSDNKMTPEQQKIVIEIIRRCFE